MIFPESPHLVSKIEKIISLDMQVLGLLTEMAENISDHTLRSLIIGLIGDENGNIRFLTLLLLLIKGNDNPTKNRKL